MSSVAPLSASPSSVSCASEGRFQPFTASEEPPPRGRFARLVHISSPERAERALVNRLAANGPSTLTPGALGAIFQDFGVGAAGTRRILVKVWRQAVAAALADDVVTGDEASYLGDLRRTLGLTDRELRQVEEDLVHGRFQQAVDGAIDDGQLTTREREKLKQLASALRVPQEVSDRIVLAARQAVLQGAVAGAVGDERLSPQEMADLEALACSLDLRLVLDEATQATFDRYALLWRVENGQLPALSVPINLQRNETCHAVADAVWMETRTRTQRINYGGPVASIRICKGLHYRVGSVRVQRITREELVEIDRGRVYVTNKRIIFDGRTKNTTMRLNSLLSFTPFSDGVVLEKASGRPPHLVLTGDVELFHAVLAAVLAASE